jgi:lysophospholipase L1-like esterase
MQIRSLLRAVAAPLLGPALGALALLGVLWGPTTALAGGAATSPVMVAMGDSYSSGEGACTPQTTRNCGYLAGTDTLVDRCHRSTHAWPYLAASDLMASGAISSFVFAACSGSVVADLYGPNHRFRTAEPVGQLEQLRAITRDPARYVKAVTLTIGGNDEDFTGVLTACILGGTTCIGRRQKVADGPFVQRLRIAYRDIHRAAPDARLYVLGYPNLFARPAFALRCDMPPASAEWIRGRIGHIDDLIRRAVRQVDERNATSFAVYVPTRASFDGHELCRRPADRGETYLNHLIGFPFARSESFHPNIPGQQALLRTVKPVLARLSTP